MQIHLKFRILGHYRWDDSFYEYLGFFTGRPYGQAIIRFSIKFRKVIANKAVKGPIVISFTKTDLIVAKAYSLASLIAGQVAAALGDKNDKCGGLGRNGAQKTPEAAGAVLLAFKQALSFDGRQTAQFEC